MYSISRSSPYVLDEYIQKKTYVITNPVVISLLLEAQDFPPLGSVLFLWLRFLTKQEQIEGPQKPMDGFFSNL